MKKDNKLGLVLIIFCAVVYGLIFQLPEKAKLYPLIVNSILAVLTIIHLIITNINHSADEGPKDQIEFRQLLTVLAGSFIYVLLIDKIGYLTTTFLYVFGILMYLIRNLKKSLLIGLAFIIFIYVLFKLGLKVPLPKGFLM